MANFWETEDLSSMYDVQDIESNKAIAGIAYFGILFWLPLVAAPKSEYAKFHANQAMVLFIASIVASIASGIIGLIPIIGTIAGFAISIAVFAMFVLGLYNGFTGKVRKLPFIGDITIIK